MLDPPRGQDLLASARACLLDDVVPALAPEHRRRVAMIADAMGIAERELRDAGHAATREVRHLAELYEEKPPPMLEPDEIAGYVRGMNVRLVRDIRAGALDDRKAGRLRRVLLEQVLARLRISSPRYLRASGYG